MKTASKSKSKSAASSSKSSASSDALSLLKADHKKVKDLFDEFEEAEEGEKEALVQEAIKELKVHAVIEEEIFYPAVREALEEKGEEEAEIMNEAEEEHRVAKTIIEELEDGSSSDDNYDAKVMVLAENIRHHIEEEEKEMFKKAKSSDVDLEELGEKMMARKQELMENESALESAIAASEVKPYQELN